MSCCWNVTLLRPSRGLRPLWVHERRSLAVKRRPFSLLAVANLPGASRGQKFIPQAVGGHHVANSAAVVAAPAPPLPQQLSYGGGNGQVQQTVKPGELRHVMVNVNYVDDVNYLEHLFQRAPASGSGVVPLADPMPQLQQADPATVQQPAGAEFEDISSLLGQDLGSMLGELQQFSTELAGLSNEFFSSDEAQSTLVLEQATAKVQKERQRKQARAVKAAASRAPKASSSSKAGSSRAGSSKTGSSARKRVKGTLTTSTRTTRAGAAAAAAAAAAAGEDGAVPNVLIRSTINSTKGSRRSSVAASRGSRTVAAAAAAAATTAAPDAAADAAPQQQEQQQPVAAQAVQASQEQQQAGGAVEQVAAPASGAASSSSSSNGADLRGNTSSGVVPFPARARARAAARTSSHLSWGRTTRAAPAAATRLKKSELGREAQTNPAMIMRSITQRTLLSGEQERQLAAFVQPLVELERTAVEFKVLHRRPPTDVELAAAAGMGLPDMEQARTLGTQAREHMVNCNIRLVTSIAKKYLGRGMDLQDMVAEGVLGLRRGVEKFDPSKGFKFSTYAHWWIRQAITRSISDQGRVVRLPVHLHEAMSKVKRVEELLMQELGRHPSEEEVAARSGMSWAKLNYLHKCFRNPVTGDGPALLGGDDREDGDQRGHEAMEEDEEQDPARVAAAILLQDDLNNVLLTLTDREAGILRMRFGLDDGVEKTLEEVGRAFNVTRERIRQIESKAIRKLRSPSRMMQLYSV